MNPFAPLGYVYASDTDFQNIGLCQISSKIPTRPVKYRPWPSDNPRHMPWITFGQQHFKE